MFVPQTALSIGANMGHPCKPPAASPSCRFVKQRAGIKMIRQMVLAFRPAGLRKPKVSPFAMLALSLWRSDRS